MEIDNFMSFEGPVFENGPTVYLNGTAKSIYEQVIALNPDYESTFAPHATDNSTGTADGNGPNGPPHGPSTGDEPGAEGAEGDVRPQSILLYY